jgi:hypothetical protein
MNIGPPVGRHHHLPTNGRADAAHPSRQQEGV